MDVFSDNGNDEAQYRAADYGCGANLAQEAQEALEIDEEFNDTYKTTNLNGKAPVPRAVFVITERSVSYDTLAPIAADKVTNVLENNSFRSVITTPINDSAAPSDLQKRWYYVGYFTEATYGALVPSYPPQPMISRVTAPDTIYYVYSQRSVLVDPEIYTTAPYPPGTWFSPIEVALGDEVAFTIDLVVRENMTNIAASDLLPWGMTVVAGSNTTSVLGTAFVVTNVDGRQLISWNIPNITPGSYRFMFRATVNRYGVYVNDAYVSFNRGNARISASAPPVYHAVPACADGALGDLNLCARIIPCPASLRMTQGSSPDDQADGQSDGQADDQSDNEAEAPKPLGYEPPPPADTAVYGVVRVVDSIRYVEEAMSDLLGSQSALVNYAISSPVSAVDLVGVNDSVDNVVNNIGLMEGKLKDKLCTSLNWLNRGDCSFTAPTNAPQPTCPPPDTINPDFNICISFIHVVDGPLPGVEFELYTLDFPPVFVESSFTNNAGTIQFTDIPAGQYKIIMTDPSNSEVAIPSKYLLTVSGTGNATLAITG
ncbi:hypothetical protein FACS18948_5050 [Clostridia bacterium]|nr:hypothetical protein FACS18948_5050 [Clostridia bacterium]